MKHQRLPLYLTIAGILVAFSLTGYSYYLSQQTRKSLGIVAARPHSS